MIFHIPHMTLRLPHIECCSLLWVYIITLHIMMWHERWTQIYRYDDTFTCHNLTMMKWTLWGGRNTKMSFLMLHLAFLMIDMIYDSSSWKTRFVSHIHPQKGIWSYLNPLSHHTMSSFCFGPWSASCIHDNSLWCLLSESVSLCFILVIFYWE